MKKKDRKLYNVTESAKALGIHRQTLNYWRRKGWLKGWLKVKKDYRNLPVFTREDLDKIREWRNTTHE